MYEWHPLLGRIGQFIELGGNIKIGRHVAIMHILGNVNTFCMFFMHFLFFFVFFSCDPCQEVPPPHTHVLHIVSNLFKVSKLH